jgi:hypothetical protein
VRKSELIVMEKTIDSLFWALKTIEGVISSLSNDIQTLKELLKIIKAVDNQ